jgi:hypothetical protein
MCGNTYRCHPGNARQRVIRDPRRNRLDRSRLSLRLAGMAILEGAGNG